MKIGYARVSTLDQNSELQLDALKVAGCEKTFQDKISGATADRPGLAEALAYVRPGDSLVVGVGWYQESQWHLLLEHAEDKEQLSPS